MYLKPLVYYYNGSDYVPLFSFADCVIDPVSGSRPTAGTNKKFWIASCGGYASAMTLDEFKWPPLATYLPDYANQVVDPVTNFVWVPWTIDIPQQTSFDFERLQNYYDPSISYLPPATAPKVSRTVWLYADPYLACHRMVLEPMRMAILVANATFWQPQVNTPHSLSYAMTENYYTYDPSVTRPESRTCMETPMWVLLYWKLCKEADVPSKVLKVCFKLLLCKVFQTKF